MKYEVIDNFLNREDFLNIKNLFFPENEHAKKIFWYYVNGIVRDPKLGPTGYEENDWMYQHPFISSQTKNQSDHVYLINPILRRLNSNKILDARANLLVPTKKHIHHEDHVDRKIFHKVALFYVSTNNGFTILKNYAKINCIENRMVIFDGTIYHHSVTSTDNIRCVININFVPQYKLGNFNFIYK